MKQRREQLNISLEKVEYLTKIPKRYLRAIENGNWDSLPEAVYTRGFIRSYARIIRMELPEQSLEVIADAPEIVDQGNYMNDVRNRRGSWIDLLATRVKKIFGVRNMYQ